MNTAPLDIAATENLLAFWRDAGVEACYGDTAVDRTLVPPPVLKAVARATASVASPLSSTSTSHNLAEVLSEARRLAASADTLDGLGQVIATFEGCPLKSMGARQSVFCRGNPDGDLLVIGEGPGPEEDARGEPFVGKAGQLLDRMLTAANLLDRAFITNTVFWRPPGNRTPTPEEQAVCAPFLERALVLMRPRAVLLLGAAASRSVLKTDVGIMKLRGQWQDWRVTESGGEPVVAPAISTLHPAFLLRQPQAKRQVWADILSLSERLDTANPAPVR